MAKTLLNPLLLGIFQFFCPKEKSEELTFTKETMGNVRVELIKLSYLGNGQSTCFTYDIVVNLKFQVSDISTLRY